MFKNFKKSTVLLLAAAFISFLLSVTLWFSGFKDEGLYVGLWVPSILAFGLFYKTKLQVVYGDLFIFCGILSDMLGYS